MYAVVSRRARGLSIGVNLNPDKACNFDCPYCQVDRTTPGGPTRVEVADLAAELESLLRRAAGDLWTTPPFDTVVPELRRVADVAFAGDGEPTTPPEFPAAARAAREARDRLAPGVPLRLLTNATLLHKDRVRAALAEFDELWCKLDAGTEAYFQLVDGTRLPFPAHPRQPAPRRARAADRHPEPFPGSRRNRTGRRRDPGMGGPPGRDRGPGRADRPCAGLHRGPRPVGPALPASRPQASRGNRREGPRRRPHRRCLRLRLRSAAATEAPPGPRQRAPLPAHQGGTEVGRVRRDACAGTRSCGRQSPANADCRRGCRSRAGRRNG